MAELREWIQSQCNVCLLMLGTVPVFFLYPGIVGMHLFALLAYISGHMYFDFVNFLHKEQTCLATRLHYTLRKVKLNQL